ncbi:MAG: hypothetical protein PHS41_12965, partial [Victivallaceae bacterium]|nr:hypothetical protein [Victivallaceae bacterium]
GYHEELDYAVAALEKKWSCALIDNLYVRHYENRSFGNTARHQALRVNAQIFREKWGRPIWMATSKYPVTDPIPYLKKVLYKELNISCEELS